MLYIIIAAALILSLSFICYYIVFFSPHKGDGDFHKLPEGEQYEKHSVRMLQLIDELLEMPYEAVKVISQDGKELSGRYYQIDKNAGVDIYFHGYRGSGVRDFCGGARLGMELGRNVLLVDQRAHGNSQGRSICFGLKERFDCLSWINYVLCRFGEDTDINLYGVSMGGASVLMASALDLPENVRRIVADSPYDSAADIIKKVCGDRKLPAALVYPFISLGALLFAGIRLDSMSCSKAVRQAKIPILIIHGEDDRFVPCQMSENIRKANPSLVTRVTFPKAGHGISYIEDKLRYRALVSEFVKIPQD